MTNEPKIRPAMTEAEWAGPSFQRKNSWGNHVTVEGPDVVVESDYGFRPPERHALAALCLHEQPFGFTWEDVDDLRRAVAFAQEAAEAACGTASHRNACDACQASVDRYKARVDSLADRIAALLPPREP